MNECVRNLTCNTNKTSVLVNSLIEKWVLVLRIEQQVWFGVLDTGKVFFSFCFWQGDVPSKGDRESRGTACSKMLELCPERLSRVRLWKDLPTTKPSPDHKGQKRKAPLENISPHNSCSWGKRFGKENSARYGTPALLLQKHSPGWRRAVRQLSVTSVLCSQAECGA